MGVLNARINVPCDLSEILSIRQNEDNEAITLKDIPLAAYDYVVNGKPALEWLKERKCVKDDSDSGITNDAS